MKYSLLNNVKLFRSEHKCAKKSVLFQIPPDAAKHGVWTCHLGSAVWQLAVFKVHRFFNSCHRNILPWTRFKYLDLIYNFFIVFFKICDNISDCVNGEDEQNCTEDDTTVTVNDSTEKSIDETTAEQSSAPSSTAKADTTIENIENTSESTEECSQFKCG